MKHRKHLVTFCLLLGLISQWLNLPYLILSQLHPSLTKQSANPVPSASAAYQFTANAQTVTTSGGTAGNYINTRNSDGDYMRILTTASGLDVSYTIPDVRLWNANTLVVYYDGFSSAAGLTYQIQIRDFANSTWRNIVPHETTLANTSDNATAGLVYQAATTTDAPTSGYVEIYNGYFSNGSNTPVNTPLSNFVDSQDNVQIRFLSSTSTPNLELSIDLLGVQATNNPFYYPSNMTITNGSLNAGEYNDTTTDDASGVTINHSGTGLDAYFSFSGVALPYSDANTYLVQVSGNRSAAGNYSFALRDFVNNQWDALNSVALTNTTDATNYFALVPSLLSQNMSDYINNGEIRVQVSSSTTSGNTVVDFVRVIIGSTNTESGIYTGTLTRGTTSTGTAANVRTMDTSTTDSTWVINTANTSGLAGGTEIHGDCNAATNHCTAGTITLPVTLPADSVSQGLYTFYRFNTSNVALDVNWYVKNPSIGYQQIANTNNIAAITNISRELSNPVRPILNGTAIATPTFQPQRYVNTQNNSVQLRFASTGADTTARTTTIDFAFATVKTILPIENNQYRYQATGATLTNGTNNASNYTATLTDDTTYWVVTQNGTTGTDVYLSFTGVTIPTGSNKLILTSTQGWSGASTLYDMYIYDFTNTTWRKITPHESQLTSGTAGTISYTQFEIFDGYFSNGSNTPVSTPLATNFISSNEVRIRIVSTSTTSALSWDYAQLQFVIDPAYFPTSRTVTTGTGTNEYNDTYTDEGATTTVNCNSSFFCFFVTPSSNTADFYFSFTNVVTPPEGFNSVMVEFSGFKATAGTYDLQIRNFTTSSWENIATGLNNTADATYYFLFEVGDWQNYISNGETRVRINSTGNANAVYVDFLQITLGSAPGANTTLEDTYGTIMNGTAASMGNANTFASLNEFDPSIYSTFTTSNSTSHIRGLDELAGKSFRLDMPFAKDPGTSIAGIIWAYRAQTGSASLTLSPSVDDPGSHFRLMTNSFLYSLTTVNGLPTAADTVTIGSTTQTFRQGWYVDQLEDLWESTENRMKFRLSTTSSTTNADGRCVVDFVFLSYRWIPSKTTSVPDTQLRHGKFWFGGEKQKNSF